MQGEKFTYEELWKSNSENWKIFNCYCHCTGRGKVHCYKIWDPSSFELSGRKEVAIKQQLSDSLQRLGIDYIDLYY